MTSFVKNIFSTLVGVFLAFIALALLLLVGFSIALAISNSPKPIEEKSILRIPLTGILEERQSGNYLDNLLGNTSVGLGLQETLEAISRAKKDPHIVGIFLEGGLLQASPASLEELRNALLDFKQSKKFIVSYSGQYTQGAYYVCTTADDLILNPAGILDWHGMSVQPIFYTELLANLGIRMQVFKVGAYKSAVEPYTSTAMSDQNREQVTSFLQDIWKQMLTGVSQRRQIPVETLQEYADSCLAFAAPEKVKKEKMVDKLLYLDGVRDLLKAKTKLKKDQSLNMVSVNDVISQSPSERESQKIAIYYAFGDIVDIGSESMVGGHEIVGSTVVRDLDKLANDKTIKAVVLRINSGGGSAYASEQIWRAVVELKKQKPVIVSMGDYAASGGYYMASSASRIFANATTLTGSIGVFGMYPDASQLTKDKLGLHFDVVKTAQKADIGTLSRPMNESEKRIVQASVDRNYTQFIQHVAQGRRKTANEINRIAQGRVWTGRQALTNRLVDELGGLKEAIAYAAKASELKTYSIENYPLPRPWYMDILENKRTSYFDEKIKSTLGDLYVPYNHLQKLNQYNGIQARMPFILNLK